VVSVSVRLGPAGSPLGTASVDLLPLSVSAAVAAGGIDCPPPAPTVDSPADGAVLGDTTPTFSGTGTPGAAISLLLDGTTATNVVPVDPDGDWSYTPVTPLGQGPHTVSATQTLNGATSPESAEIDFTLSDSQAPAAPVINAPADGSSTNDNTPAVTGTGEPGATVTVRVDGDVVGTPTVDGNGNWEVPPPTEPVADGEHKLTATQTDEAGNTSPPDEVGFAVDTKALPPSITDPNDGSTTNANTPTLAGTAEPGSRVILFVDGRPVGSVVADAEGNWRLILNGNLPDGEHEISAIAVDPAGNESGVKAITLTIDTSDDGSGPGSGPVLARTGGPQVAVAGALLLTGGGVLLTVRRRMLGQ
jgi:large repetitive protein